MRDDLHDVLGAHFPPPVDFSAHGCGIEPADDLVRQVQMPLVALRHLQRRLDRVVHQTHGVVAFEPGAQVVKDAPRLLDARLRHVHRAEAPRQRFVLLDVFLVLAQRGRTDHPDVAARASTDLNTLAASDGAPSAEPAPTIVCASSTNRIRFGALLDLADHVLDAILEHAAEHRAGDHRVHLQVDDLAVAQPDGHTVGLELDAPRQSFDDGRLADPGLADEHHRVRTLAMAEDFQHLLDLVVAAVDRRELVLTSEQVEVGREVLEKRRQLEALAQTFFAQLVVAHPGRNTRHEHFRFDAVAPDDRHGAALALFENRWKQIG